VHGRDHNSGTELKFKVIDQGQGEDQCVSCVGVYMLRRAVPVAVGGRGDRLQLWHRRLLPGPARRAAWLTAAALGASARSLAVGVPKYSTHGRANVVGRPSILRRGQFF